MLITHPSRPAAFVASILRNRQLLFDLTKRDAVGRYKGSMLGILWSLLTPMLMLAVYTFVFSEVFKARWGSAEGSRAEFAVTLFSGLIVFNVFGECVNRAPGVILVNANYVKKVVFPLEILPCVNLLSALFHATISIVVLLVFQGVVGRHISSTFWLFPVVLLPLGFFTLGISWLLAATGVYLRDIGQTIGVVVTAMLFLSPVFFPISAIPERWRLLAELNPLAFPIEQGRNVLVLDQSINWAMWWIYLVASSLISWLGFAWFQRVRKGFADVL